MAQETILVKDGGGDNESIAAVADEQGIKSWITIDKPFGLAVSMGQVDGYSTLDKFGVNPLITTGTDPEDVWEGGGEYPYDTDGTAPIVSLASNDAADNQDIEITGLDITGAEVVQTVTLNGTARVALSTALWRVYRMQNVSSANISGTAFCYTGTGTVPSIGDPEVRAIIDDGNNQTLMALYTVPAGKVGFLLRGEIGLEMEGNASALAEYAHIHYESRRLGGAFTVKKAITCIIGGSATYQDVRSVPDIIPANTDVRIRVIEVTQDMGVWATFDMYIVDEGKFSDAYLASIGQPGY